MSEDTQHAPSAARRKRLKEREAIEGKTLMNVLDSYPVEKYYTMSERLIDAFGQALDERRLDDAYVFGLRFATFSIESLPQHAQFNRPSNKYLRAKNARQVDEVLKKLESVATRMDAEELKKARQRREIEQARQKEAEARRKEEERKLHELETKRQQHQAILQRQREELQAQQAAEKVQKKKQEQLDLEQRARDKLMKLNMQSQSQETNNAAVQPRQERDATSTTKPSLISAHTGQDRHTKEAVEQQKEQARKEAQEREEAAKQKEAEKQQANAQKVEAQSTVSKFNIFQRAQPKKKATVQPKQQQSQSTPKLTGQQIDGYKAEFAKYKAEWAKHDKTKQEPKEVPAKQASSRQVATEPPTQRPSAPKHSSTNKMQDVSTIQPPDARQAPPQKSSSQPNVAMPQLPTAEPNKRDSSPIKGPAQPKSKMKLFQLSPKRKSTKQVVPASHSPVPPKQQEPTEEEGFELKMTDAGPTIVDDFSYHDDAYRAKLTPTEAKAIQMLENAIQLQEKRLKVLEASNERAVLRREAKKRLHDGDRKGALKCLAKKKHINQTIEVVKQAVFNMETQIIMLESAVENREVNKIMKEASDVMASFGNGVRVSDFTDERLGDVLASVGQGGMDLDYDEEELLSELQDGEVGGVEMTDDDNGLLSLPTVPQDEVIPDELPKKEEDAVKTILASLF